MGTLSAKVSELMINQKHMLEAIKYLDDSIKDILEKIDNEKTDHAKKILENSEDIVKLQKSKDENDIEIKQIEDKIKEVYKEIIVLEKMIKTKRLRRATKYMDMVIQLNVRFVAKHFAGLLIWKST